MASKAVDGQKGCLDTAIRYRLCVLSRAKSFMISSFSLTRWNRAVGKDGAESCGFSSWIFQVRVWICLCAIVPFSIFSCLL